MITFVTEASCASESQHAEHWQICVLHLLMAVHLEGGQGASYSPMSKFCIWAVLGTHHQPLLAPEDSPQNPSHLKQGQEASLTTALTDTGWMYL